MQNTEQGVFRKMSALRSFYGYFYKRQLIEKNPTLLVDMPKIREKEIIRLEADEVASLLDFVEHGGDHLTGQKRAYYEKTKERDLAIITLLLGTGIRVSELVGLNVDDVDFRNNGLHLIRKGRKEMTVYFGNEVADALEQYMEGSRKLVIPKEGHEDALFYSMQRRRIGVQAVQNLVKKYAKEVTPLKRSRLINCVVLMVRLYIRKRMIFILWRKFLDILMLIRPENIMQQCLIRDVVRQQEKLC